jgi:cell division protein FtsB
MFDFHEKRKIRSFMYSKATILGLFGVALLLSFSVYDRYEVAREMEGKLESKQAELDALRERATALESKVKYLDDDRGLEEELRNRFDVVREGEQTVILIDSREGNGKEKPKDATVQQQTPEPEESFFEKLKFWE